MVQIFPIDFNGRITFLVDARPNISDELKKFSDIMDKRINCESIISILMRN